VVNFINDELQARSAIPSAVLRRVSQLRGYRYPSQIFEGILDIPGLTDRAAGLVAAAARRVVA